MLDIWTLGCTDVGTGAQRYMNKDITEAQLGNCVERTIRLLTQVDEPHSDTFVRQIVECDCRAILAVADNSPLDKKVLAILPHNQILKYSNAYEY